MVTGRDSTGSVLLLRVNVKFIHNHQFGFQGDLGSRISLVRPLIKFDTRLTANGPVKGIRHPDDQRSDIRQFLS